MSISLPQRINEEPLAVPLLVPILQGDSECCGKEQAMYRKLQSRHLQGSTFLDESWSPSIEHA